MRGQALIAVSVFALAAIAQPAAAQQYRSYQDGYVAHSRACQQSRTNRTVGGAAIGGITGAVVGSQMGARGHRSDGSLLGAVVGAVIGGAIGNSSARNSEQCKADVEGRYDPYYGYAQGPYDDRYADAGGDYNDDELEGGPDGYYSGK